MGLIMCVTQGRPRRRDAHIATSHMRVCATHTILTHPTYRGQPTTDTAKRLLFSAGPGTLPVAQCACIQPAAVQCASSQSSPVIANHRTSLVAGLCHLTDCPARPHPPSSRGRRRASPLLSPRGATRTDSTATLIVASGPSRRDASDRSTGRCAAARETSQCARAASRRRAEATHRSSQGSHA